MLMILVLALGAGPRAAHFELSAGGWPLGQLSIEVDGPRLHYRARGLAGATAADLTTTLEVDTRRPPETLALLWPPGPGCQPVTEERTGAVEQLCVDGPPREGRVSGTVDGVPFEAVYAEPDGSLTSITFPSARWRRRPGPSPRPASTPFLAGFAVHPAPGAVRLEPGRAGVARVAQPVRGTGASDGGRCLEVARAAVDRDRSLTLVTGLRVHRGRAVPHAWVRRGPAHEDPSFPAGESARGLYLAFPPDAAGQLYLDLLEGTQRVVGGR